ncbi:MAG: HAD-IIB family hydrolase, partial [Eubacterium sp.]
MNRKAKIILDAMNRRKSVDENINKQFFQEKIQYEDNIKSYNTQKIHKICLWSGRDVFKGVQEILGDTMELAQADTGGNRHYYEIIQKGCNKGKAIEVLQDRLGISRAETLCFGDGQNDIAMFEASGT